MSALATAAGIIRSKVRGRRLAKTIAATTPPSTPVAVYFADAPSGLYQLRRWYPVLEALNATHPVSIITSDPFTYAAVRAETSVFVTFADGPTQLDRVVNRQSIGVILYPNHNAFNFRVLRFATPVHAFIGHGDSAKDSSVSRQLKAYDFAFVADADSIDQLKNIRGYDAEASAVIVGSPWLGFLPDPPTTWVSDERKVVLYAPTWEGDRPTMDYSSVESVGEQIAVAVLGDPTLRLIYRPHPWLGRVRPASAAADARIRRLVERSGHGDVVDTGAYGWSLRVADACVTDVSSVAFDARALGLPLVLTVPTSTQIPPVADSVYANATRLGATDAPAIHASILAALENATPASTRPVASTEAFVAAIEKALKISGDRTL